MPKVDLVISKIERMYKSLIRDSTSFIMDTAIESVISLSQTQCILFDTGTLVFVDMSRICTPDVMIQRTRTQNSFSLLWHCAKCQP